MGQFLKQTFASFIGSLAGLILFFALGTSGLVLLLVSAALRDDSPKIKDKSVLVLDLSMQISDTKPPSSLGKAFSDENTNIITLRQVLDSLEKATKDKRIVGLFLDGRSTGEGSGYATLKEVRAALESFRAAGKKIIAYDVDWSEREYYLGSVADTVMLNPMGVIEINGFSSQQLFLTGAFQKYGIGVQVIRVGNYKSAIEPFTRQNLSPENRQQTQELLADLWGEFLSTVGESRELTPKKLQAIADSKGFLNPEEARASGLVDRVAYFDQVIGDLKELTGNSKKDKSFRQIRLKTYADVPLENAQESSSENKIAVVYAEGTIVSGKGTVRQIGSDRFAKELRKLRQDEDVKAVVLRVNSPGGSATASEIILREVQLTSSKKPVIVSMGNVAASGGYWISTGADRIFAEANTITGSIGVFGLLFNIQEIGNNNGITWDVVKTGRFADINTTIRPKTKEELALYQKYANQIYDLFLNKVAESRNLTVEEVAKIAQGRIWSGEDAQKIGLVDQIGGLEAAIEYAAQKAELGNDWEITEYPKQRSFEEEILERLLDAEVVEQVKQLDPLTAEFIKFKEDLAIFHGLNDPRGIYARLPFKLRIE
ncbi:MAG: signal peptide peptidase SppA [Xenococcaceae cyanobacterium]